MARPNWEYIRVDVLLPSHPKLDGVGVVSKWCLIELWCYCGQHLTDGFVPENQWRRCGTASARRVLLERGFAEALPGGGYRMHDYLGHQRSKADAQELSRKRAEAGRKGGQAKANARASAVANAKQVPEPVDNPDSVASASGTPSAPSENRVATVLQPSRDPGSTTGKAPRSAPSKPSKRVAEAEAEAEIVTADVGDRSSRRNARSDDLTDSIISEIHQRTGRIVKPDWAAGVASMLLAGRDPDDPAAYVRAAIRSERNPRERFLPAAADHPSARTPAEAAFVAGIVPNGRPADDETVAAVAAQVRQAITRGNA